MLEFLNSQFASGVATALTIVGAVFAFRNWQKKRSSRLFFSWNRLPLVLGSPPSGFTVTVTGGGITGSALYRDLFLLSNRTDQTITDDDFVELPVIPRHPSGKIFRIEPLEGFNGQSNTPVVSEHGIGLSGLKIPKNEAVAFEILHDGLVIERLDSLTKSIPDVGRRELSRADKLDPIFLLLLTFAGIFIYVDRGATREMLIEANLSPPVEALVVLSSFALILLVPWTISFLLNKSGMPRRLSYLLRNYSRSDQKFAELEQPAILHALQPALLLEETSQLVAIEEKRA